MVEVLSTSFAHTELRRAIRAKMSLLLRSGELPEELRDRVVAGHRSGHG